MSANGDLPSDRASARHTRVPNDLLDMVIFRLKPAEQACLMYVLRRTVGFADKTGGGHRKKVDRIAISQFINGTRSGKYVLDVGTGLSRTSVINALASLEDYGIVRVSFECPMTRLPSGRLTGCGWHQNDAPNKPEVDPKTSSRKCPRCKRTLSKTYGLATLTPSDIVKVLNRTEPEGQPATWRYEKELRRFYQHDAQPNCNHEAAAEQSDLETLRKQLWWPDLVDVIIGHLSSANKSGKISPNRLRNSVIQPLVEMQGQFTKDAMKYALNEVIRRNVARTPGKDTRWQNYLKACAKGHLARIHKDTEKVSAAVHGEAVTRVLERCAELNLAGDQSNAQQLFKEMIGDHLATVAENDFAEDTQLARRHLLEAFKRGQSDYVFVREYMSANDFIPSWTWEQDESR